ncbi:H-X9-DG-CTERM domain-containing protein [Gemmata sp.]|uniref:H-X9-DG-CTERM domain-containing protein n=1 Tax=Gemmata sp. TaxID=1914242 RepID=UPI003F71A838
MAAWSTGACNSTVPNTPHPGVANAALADASVRAVSAAVDGSTWWALCTPAGGDLPGGDW